MHSESLQAVTHFQSVVLERFLAHSRFYQQHLPSHATPELMATYRALHETLLVEEGRIMESDPAACGILHARLRPVLDEVRMGVRANLDTAPPTLAPLVEAHFLWRHWYRHCLLVASCRRAELEGT